MSSLSSSTVRVPRLNHIPILHLPTRHAPPRHGSQHEHVCHHKILLRQKAVLQLALLLALWYTVVCAAHVFVHRACAGARTDYGRDDVPIGALKTPPEWQWRNAGSHAYVEQLASGWPSPIKTSAQVLSAVAVYRRVLSQQPDGSVVVVSVGMTTNLAMLHARSRSEPRDPLANVNVDTVPPALPALCLLPLKKPPLLTTPTQRQPTTPLCPVGSPRGQTIIVS